MVSVSPVVAEREENWPPRIEETATPSVPTQSPSTPLGCATLGGEPLPRLVIRALDANRFLVENREVSRQKLARAARRARRVEHRRL